MLKKILFKNKEIPVPVPLKTLEEALKWVESTFVRENSLLTKMRLNNKDVLTMTKKDIAKIKLDKSSQLEVVIDTPKDLSVQTLEAMRDLAFGINSRLQFLSVKCWQEDMKEHKSEMVMSMSDVELMIDMINHVNGIVDFSHEDMAPVNGLMLLVKRVKTRIDQNLSVGLWKECAQNMLNGLQPLLKELIGEIDHLQLRIVASS